MDWARMLAYITGTVDQELLLRNEFIEQLQDGHGRARYRDAASLSQDANLAAQGLDRLYQFNAAAFLPVFEIASAERQQ